MSGPVRVEAEVVAQSFDAPGYCRLRLRAPSLTIARPGQFVHVLPRGINSHDPLLRRAFSVLSVNQDVVEILYRVQGRGTELMSRWRSGDVIDLLGPLGNGFSALPERPTGAILVGGGVGVPPLAMLASTRRGDQEVSALIGARSKADVLCLADLNRHGITTRIATDDGSSGHHGLVTDLLREELQDRQAAVFSCGPWPMLRAVAAICAEFEAPCQVSLEEAMPCGIGICNGCVVAVRNGGSEYGRFRRVCVEGPVMDSREIDWDGVVE